MGDLIRHGKASLALGDHRDLDLPVLAGLRDWLALSLGRDAAGRNPDGDLKAIGFALMESPAAGKPAAFQEEGRVQVARRTRDRVLHLGKMPEQLPLALG